MTINPYRCCSKTTTITKRSGRENTEGEIDKELHHQGDKKIDSDSRNSLRERNGIGESDAMKERQENHKNKECEIFDTQNCIVPRTDEDNCLSCSLIKPYLKDDDKCYKV